MLPPPSALGAPEPAVAWSHEWRPIYVWARKDPVVTFGRMLVHRIFTVFLQVPMGVCVGRKPVFVHLFLTQANQICAVSYGNNACVGGFSCIGNEEIGFCTENAVTAVLTIPNRQSEGEACDMAFGSNACASGTVCYSSYSGTTGICTRFGAHVREGQVCDISLGINACEVGYYCYSGNGFAYASTGIRTIDTTIATPTNANWYIQWKTHQWKAFSVINPVYTHNCVYSLFSSSPSSFLITQCARLRCGSSTQLRRHKTKLGK